jgi:carbon storage regulator
MRYDVLAHFGTQYPYLTDMEVQFMLILTRRPGESLLIGDDIEITLINVEGNQVKVGIKAPDDITILRAELLERQGGVAGSDRSVILRP